MRPFHLQAERLAALRGTPARVNEGASAGGQAGAAGRSGNLQDWTGLASGVRTIVRSATHITGALTVSHPPHDDTIQTSHETGRAPRISRRAALRTWIG